MTIVDFFYDNYDVIVDSNCNKAERIKAFQRIADYICKMRQPSSFVVAIIEALLSEMESNIVNETYISKLMRELEGAIYLQRKPNKILLLSEENNVAVALRACGTEGLLMIPCWAFSADWVDSYDVLLQCGEKPFDSKILKVTGEGRVINAYKVFLNQMCINPSSHMILAKYESGVEDAEVVVTGMSYTRNAIRAEFIDKKLISLANSSQDLYYDFLCFKDAVEKGKKLNTVIIGLAPYSLRYDLSKTRMDYRIYFYQELFDDSHNNERLKEELHVYHSHIKAMKEVFSDKEFDYLFHRLADLSRIEMVERTRGIFDPSGLTDPELEEMKSKFDKPYEDTILENKQILREYIKCAISRNIRVYIFMPPYTSWYKQHWKQEYQDEVLNYVYELGEEFDFDLIDLSSLDFPDSYFGDYAHVNNIGAIAVASIINQVINN